MFNSLLSFLAAFVLAFSYLAHGAPAVVHPVEDIVFSPAILYPTAGVVWATGSAQNVTWATNNLPAELQDGKGLLLLGHETDGSENLDISKCGKSPDRPPLLIFFFSRTPTCFSIPPQRRLRSVHRPRWLGQKGRLHRRV